MKVNPFLDSKKNILEFFKKHQFDKVVKFGKKLIKKNSDFQLFYVLGISYFSLKNYREAEKTFTGPEQLLQVYVVDTTGGENSLIITDQLRQNGFKVDRSFGGRSMKAQMKAADKSGAKIALIVGEDEVEKGVVTIRDLRGEEGQEEIASGSIIANLEKRLG